MKNSAPVVHVRLLSGERVQILLAKASEEEDSILSWNEIVILLPRIACTPVMCSQTHFLTVQS